ncbi:hypothetical protein [Flavobacterium sp. WV_118_3]|uniref:hypothetical protein n=1 Tax=Flavobacterium sp. WV_118_3 TaxID=3151764 RepID=UPI0032190147
MNTNMFNEAEDLFTKGNFITSFNLFKSLTESSEFTDLEKAEAFNMMGVIILFDPLIDIEDETGLKYFKKALELDDENVGALLNVVENFGLSVNNHKDTVFFNFALSQLKKINYDFSENEKKMILDKQKNINTNSTDL